MSRQLKRQQREQDIVIKTMAMFSVHGFLDVKMADVAKAAACSMGVVYSHFASKEDLLLACAIELTRKKQSMLTLTTPYQCSDHQQVVLFAILIWEYNQQFPGQSEIMPMACLPSVWKRASAIRVDELRRVGAQTENLMGPRFVSLLTEAGHDPSKSKSIMCGMMGLVIGMWNIQSSGFGIIDICMEEISDKNPLIENLLHFFQGWGIELSLSVDDWFALQSIATEIINMSSTHELIGIEK